MLSRSRTRAAGARVRDPGRRRTRRVRTVRRPGMAAGDASARRLQIALGLIWLVDGVLQCQPFMFTRAFVSQIIAPNEIGQPRAVAAPIRLIAQVIEPRVVLFAALAASIQLLVGLGLIRGHAVKAALLASCGWALGVWWVGEGLGGLMTGTASPLTGAPGPAMLYVLAGAIAWPRTCTPSHGTALARPRGDRAARLLWAALWIGSAALWLAPANRAADGVQDQVAGAPSGAGWLSTIHAALASAAAGHGLVIAAIAASLSTVVGISVLLDCAARPALALAVAIALVYFIAGQGMGGILTGAGTDPGSGPLLILLATALWGDGAGRTGRRTRPCPRRRSASLPGCR